jgi:hypothetical protein
MEKFTIELTSVTDRNNPVAEIWFGERLIAEINQETDSLKIELYITEKSTFCFKEFQEVLNDAKGRLMK